MSTAVEADIIGLSHSVRFAPISVMHRYSPQTPKRAFGLKFRSNEGEELPAPEPISARLQRNLSKIETHSSLYNSCAVADVLEQSTEGKRSLGIVD